MQDMRLEFLRPKMDTLFANKEAFESRTNMDYNSAIKAGREFRNPSICEKLIERFKIQQYGSNLERSEDSRTEVGRYKKPRTIYSPERPRSGHFSRSHHDKQSSKHRSSNSSGGGSSRK